MSDAARRHDRFFRSYFERPEILGELLELALPYEVNSGIDVSTLRLEPRTYLDKDHREYFADLSASVKVNGKPAQVYVLFEHKSWSDAGTLLQLLRRADELSLAGSLRPTAAVQWVRRYRPSARGSGLVAGKA